MRLFSSGLDGRGGRKRGLGSRLSVSLPTSQAGLVVSRRHLGSYGAGPESPAPRPRGTLAFALGGWRGGGGGCAFHHGPPQRTMLASAGQGWPQVGVRGQAVPSAKALPADPAGPALPRALPPQDRSGLGLGNESLGAVQPEGGGPASSSPSAAVPFCSALPCRNGCSSH